MKRDDRLRGPRLGDEEQERPDEADEDEPTDGRLGPVAELLVGQADEQERDGDREDRAAEDVEVLDLRRSS